MTKSKLQRFQEIKQQLAQLKAEVESDVKQWQPVGGEYFIAGSRVYSWSSKDACRLFGTERPTMDQAAKAREEMRIFNRLLAYRDEFDPDFVEVWDACTKNYFVYFNTLRKEYSVDERGIDKGIGIVYMSKEVAE